MSIDSSHEKELAETTVLLHRILLDLASSEAAAVPYWAPHPPSVIGHRVAVHALRSEADRFLAAS